MTVSFEKEAKTWDSKAYRHERAQAAAQQCKQFIGNHNAHLLDFGGGTGLLGFLLKDQFDRVTIADTSPQMLQQVQLKAEHQSIAHIDTCYIHESIQEVSASLSVVATLMALHHIADVEDFVEGAHAKLEKGGKLLIADLYPDEGDFHSGDLNFCGHDGFDPRELSAYIEQRGFKVVHHSEFFRMKKTLEDGRFKEFPLFFLAAEKI